MAIKKIAVLTTGGDAPGMNAAIRGVVRTASSRKVEVMGVFRGWWGLINDEVSPLNHRSVSGIINQGGTILKTARCPDFKTAEGKRRAYETLKKYAIDGLVVIGGNGSIMACDEFSKVYPFPCMVVPGSIDNDINGVEKTIGWDTAINTALNAIDNIRDTATSMERIFVVEVMGRDSGLIALQVALCGGCEDVIIPEKPFNLEEMCHNIVNGNLVGKVSWIVVVAEGAGQATKIAKQITDLTSLETRAVVLGHVQRGGKPTAQSRSLALLLSQAATTRLLDGQTNKVLALNNGSIVDVDFEVALKKKEVDVDHLLKLIKQLT